jgi:hypothetical protein
MGSTAHPVTLYVPSSAAEPIEVKVHASGLRMVLVNRESVPFLDESWAVLGIYILLGPADKPDRYSAYVGEVGKRNLLLRIKEHVGGKNWWSRALLIASASNDLNSAEIGWLEGSLYDVLKNAVAADVMNKGRPGDQSLPLPEQTALERYVELTMVALRAAGVSPDTGDQKPVAPHKRKVYRESVKDLLEAGLLKAGTHLYPLRKNLTDTALVLDDGNLKIEDDIFEAVSPAAAAVSGNKAEAGWEFWGAPSGEGGFVSLFELRDRLREAARTKQPTPTHSDVGVSPQQPKKPAPRRFSKKMPDLIAAGLLQPGESLYPVRKSLADTKATLLPDGRIELNGQTYGSPSSAAVAASGKKAEPGWEFWAVDRQGNRIPLYDLRGELSDETEKTPAE